MKHRLNISVSKFKPTDDGIVSGKSISIREKILRRILGMPQKFTILVPGESVDEINITEKKGEEDDET